jgi:fluoride exporter
VIAWVGVALVGGLGALARFWLDGAVSRRAGGVFPAGTLAVNISGSFVLGVLVGAGVGGDALLVAGTGFVGAYTTFSTWMLETERLGEDGRWRALALNVVVSLVVGLAAVALGRWLA